MKRWLKISIWFTVSLLVLAFVAVGGQGHTLSEMLTVFQSPLFHSPVIPPSLSSSRPERTPTAIPPTATPTMIPPPPSWPTGEPWPPQITPVIPSTATTPLPFPILAFPPTPTGQRPSQLQQVWFPYFSSPASLPQLQAVLIDQQGQRWAQSEQVIDLGLRSGFPGPTLLNLHPSPDQQLLVANVAFGESIRSMIVDPFKGTIRQIPGEFAYFYAWHPDNRRVLVSALEGWLLVDVVSQSYKTIDFQSESGDWLPVRALAYSPDGERLADALVYAPNVSKPNGEIEIGIRTGEQEIRVPVLRVSGGGMLTEYSLRWSPDGRTLIFVADVHDSGKRTQLWTINVADGTSRLLATLAREVQYNQPAVWSPDGRYIAAIVEESEEGVIFDRMYLFTFESGAVRKITPFSNGRLSHLTWSPDGNCLAFTVSLGNYGEIWVTTLDGTHQYPIAGPTPPDAPFVWLP